MTTLINIVLPMLDTPSIESANLVIAEVLKYNPTTGEDLEFFQECASLVISENNL